MATEHNASGAQVPCISLLAPAWDKIIPPAMVNITTRTEQHPALGSLTSTGPAWNPEWLIGLEQFVRAVVRDELSRANDKAQVWICGGAKKVGGSRYCGPRVPNATANQATPISTQRLSHTIIKALLNTIVLLAIANPFLVRSSTSEEVEALVLVESRNKNVTGDSGRAVGVLQMWKIQVDECNRIVGYSRWSYDDRKDPTKSRHMCTVFLEFWQHLHPTESPVDRMGRWRNPNGKAPGWYLERTKTAYEAVRKPVRKEAVMAKLTIEEIPQPAPPKAYHLVLDEYEAGTLLSLMGSIGGNPRRTPRGAVDQIYRALNTPDLQQSQSALTADRLISGSIQFRDP